MLKLKYRAYHTPNLDNIRQGFDMELPMDDIEGMAEFLELMHLEEHDTELHWQVSNARGRDFVYCDDHEGWFYVIVPLRVEREEA